MVSKNMQILKAMTNISTHINLFGQSVCVLPTVKEMAGEVVNQTFVHIINSCGRLRVRASKPPYLSPGTLCCIKTKRT